VYDSCAQYYAQSHEQFLKVNRWFMFSLGLGLLFVFFSILLVLFAFVALNLVYSVLCEEIC